MLALPARWIAALAAALLIAPACGGDDEIVDDGDPGPIDSGPDAAVDAEDLCPGALTFEALAANLETGSAEFEVMVTELADPANVESSAPNGRVVLCLPDDADSEVRAEKTDYLTRVDAVPTEVTNALVAAIQPYPLFVISQAAAEALYTDLGTAFDAGDAQLVVSVLEYPGGTPLTGATVAIDKTPGAGPFARDDGGGFAAGDEIAGGGLILFGNVPPAGGDVAITVTPPDGFDGSCSGPTTLNITAGELSGALFACQ